MELVIDVVAGAGGNGAKLGEQDRKHQVSIHIGKELAEGDAAIDVEAEDVQLRDFFCDQIEVLQVSAGHRNRQ